MRCPDDLRCARTAARHRVSMQLLRHGRVYREGKKQWTKMHCAWIARQRLDDELAHAALGEMLTFLDSLDRQLAALDARLAEIVHSERWRAPVGTRAVPRALDPDRGIETVEGLFTAVEACRADRPFTPWSLPSFAIC